MITTAVDGQPTDEAGVPEVRCPVCRSVDWRQDGFLIRDRDARMEIRRVAPSHGDEGLWACGACGFELTDRLPLASALTRLQQIHWE